MNIIGKNILDVCVCTLTFYFCGFAFSSATGGGMIGEGEIFETSMTNDQYLQWFYKFSLCSTSATIVSGSLAERTFVETYLVFSILMTGIIYPIASSWVIGEGWLHQIGFHDAAGCGYVHMIGGVCGLVGTMILGPRHGVFDVNKI
mmetsp:Transcript_13637/g.21350  ORF Transcript_13637/g.21350 Transcript_13637/m.21350 type:complete len:146 (+) Transcript_13637:577-1014(+)